MPDYLIKLNRVSAWLLVAMMLIYFFTGFDIVKNLWNPVFSRYLHNQILPLPTIILVAIHTLIGLKIYLLRNLLDNKFLNNLLLTVGLIIFAIFIYFLDKKSSPAYFVYFVLLFFSFLVFLTPQICFHKAVQLAIQDALNV